MQQVVECGLPGNAKDYKNVCHVEVIKRFTHKLIEKNKMNTPEQAGTEDIYSLIKNKMYF